MKYWRAINTGYGFITSEDRSNFTIEGKPADIWITDDNFAANEWASRVGAQPITQSEAEAILAAIPQTTVMPR